VRRREGLLLGGLLLLAVVFGLLRNLPVGPGPWLAP
jgi:hypothetical protein